MSLFITANPAQVGGRRQEAGDPLRQTEGACGKRRKKVLKSVYLFGVGFCSKVVMGEFKLYSAFRIEWQQFAGYGK